MNHSTIKNSRIDIDNSRQKSAHLVDSAIEGHEKRWSFLHLVNCAFLLVVFILVVWFVISYKNDFYRLWLSSNFFFLSLSILILTFFVFGQGLLVVFLLHSLGVRTGIHTTLRIIFVALLGKYVPGKIWILTMRSTLFAQKGIPIRNVLTAAGLEHFYIIVTAIVVFLLTTRVVENSFILFQRFTAILIILFLILVPQRILKLVNKILILIKRSPLDRSLLYTRSLFFSIMFIITWFILGLGIWILARGISIDISLAELPAVSGYYAVSVVAGFLALFAPAGMGVREGAFALAMSRYMCPAEAVFFALAARLMTSLAELVALAIIYAVPLRYGKKGQDSDREGPISEDRKTGRASD